MCKSTHPEKLPFIVEKSAISLDRKGDVLPVAQRLLSMYAMTLCKGDKANLQYSIRMSPRSEEESDEIVPQVYDVMIGRSHGARNHYGTQRFRGKYDSSLVLLHVI
jgi:hypothetical protein